jgi:hypothetical protein
MREKAEMLLDPAIISNGVVVVIAIAELKYRRSR